MYMGYRMVEVSGHTSKMELDCVDGQLATFVCRKSGESMTIHVDWWTSMTQEMEDAIHGVGLWLPGYGVEPLRVGVTLGKFVDMLHLSGAA